MEEASRNATVHTMNSWLLRALGYRLADSAGPLRPSPPSDHASLFHHGLSFLPISLYVCAAAGLTPRTRVHVLSSEHLEAEANALFARCVLRATHLKLDSPDLPRPPLVSLATRSAHRYGLELRVNRSHDRFARNRSPEQRGRLTRDDLWPTTKEAIRTYAAADFAFDFGFRFDQ